MDFIKVICGDKFTALHRLLTAFFLTLLVPAVLELRTDVAVIKSRIDHRTDLRRTNSVFVLVTPAWPVPGER